MYFCIQIDTMYKAVIRSLLFKFDPEAVHYFTFDVIKLISKIPFISSLIRLFFKVQHPVLERELFGLKFQNPVGLAAGFDKNAVLYNELANFGKKALLNSTMVGKVLKLRSSCTVSRLYISGAAGSVLNL